MNFNYEKIEKSQDANGNQWTSYSDLFMCLAFIFLLLYVVASLRTGSQAMAVQAKVAQMTEEEANREKQMLVFETIKEDYLTTGASDAEKAVYEDLMKKLNLLKEEADAKKQELSQQLAEQEEKSDGLNHYQALVKNIITANLNARSMIQDREHAIEVKQEKLASLAGEVKDKSKELETEQRNLAWVQVKLKNKEKEVAAAEEKQRDLEGEVATKAREVEQQQENIATIKSNLREKEKEIAAAQSRQKELEAEMQRKVAASETKIESLKAEHEQRGAEANAKLAQLNSELQKKEQGILDQQAKNDKLIGQLEELSRARSAEIKRLAKEHGDQLAREKAAFEGELAAAKMSAEEKLAAQQAYLDGVEKKNAEFNGMVGDLKNKLKENEGKIGQLKGEQDKLAGQNQALKGLAEAERGKADGLAKKMADEQKALKGKIDAEKEKADGLAKKLADEQKALQDIIDKEKGKAAELAKKLDDEKKDKDKLQEELGKAKELADRRKDLGKAISDAFKKAGINAHVHPESGDVMLDFGKEYFDYDKYDLKPPMVAMIEKLVPVYARSLLGDAKKAAGIQDVEIVGFASPTYKRKPVNPASLAEGDRTAVNYNLDLSYKRAREIFNHIFDRRKMVYEHQKDLLKLVKVTGRSFFTEDAKGETAERLNLAQYCEAYDCAKSQKVIIRFNLKAK